jgi:predicted ATP-grasp superfamily ATP-dependent carboligase
MAVLVIAGLSIRLMAESAARAGWRVLGLDAFGDLDTQRVCQAWAPSSTGGPTLDPGRVLEGLRRYARDPRVRGWVAAGGFEGMPELLTEGARILPLLGSLPQNVARVRDPRHFFGTLDALGLAHPEVCFDAPPEPAGWLHKRFDAAGGWHIRAARADDAQLPPNHWRYWQRDLGPAGDHDTLGCLFVHHGDQVHVLGAHRILSGWQERPDGALPYVYQGLIGPLPQSAARIGQLQSALQELCTAYALRGLGSLDVLAPLDPARPLQILELNPRPSASMALYPGTSPLDTPMALHLNACLGGPPPRRSAALPTVHACGVLYAQASVEVDARQTEWLMRQPDVHDVPQPGSQFRAGDPLCSVSMSFPTRPSGETEALPHDVILRQLQDRCNALQNALLLPSALLPKSEPPAS